MEDFANFDLSSSDSETQHVARADKLKQSEEAFLTQKREWTPVCQDKHATRRLAESDVESNASLSRDEVLELKVAAEERYYARDYPRALALATRAIAAASITDPLSKPERQELSAVQIACNRRLGSEAAVPRA